MKIKRRIKLTTETERTFSFALKRTPILFFCPRCDAQAEMISINEAAKRLNADWRAVVGAVETGALHSVETGGELYICGASVSAANSENPETEVNI